MSDTPRKMPLSVMVRDPKQYVMAEGARQGLADSIAILERELAAAQAKIDNLMLEYCPDEMTPEQLAEWGRNQRPVEGSKP